jgi:hypothetical protein
MTGINRIAIINPGRDESLPVAKALAAMCGYDLSISPSFHQMAIKYRLSLDIEACQWPDSYVYCLGAFTERLIVEQRYAEKFVSDGSVFKELVWLKCRYPYVEPVYEQSMIRSLERILVEYAAKNYDVIFLLSTPSETENAAGACIHQLLESYCLPFRLIDFSDREHALQTMAEHLKVNIRISASCALSKAMRELNFE